MAVTAASRATCSLITFRQGMLDVGVKLEEVVEVVRMVALTPLADAPAHVLGVIDYRGTVIPLVDLGRRLGQAPARAGLDSKIVVVGHNGRQVGLVVDDVAGMLEVPDGAYCPRTALALPDLVVARSWLQGAVRRDAGLVLVLDVAEILTKVEELQGSARDRSLIQHTA
jgi:purine-binding chemotaxis protein CheW